MEHLLLSFSAWPAFVPLQPVFLPFPACCSSAVAIVPEAHLQQYQAVLNFQPPNRSGKTPQHNLNNINKHRLY